jgi:oxalate decarboxylase/phosphoglucose isomerase-like protein (cupin superfamily)
MSNDWKPTPIRRVITGHTDEGVATVIIDDVAQNVKSSRPNQYSTLMWCTDSAPAQMPLGRNAEDMGNRKLGTYPPVNGTRFMIAEYPPGNHPRRHRTETIDYIVVLSGEIDMLLDQGEMVTLKTGDVMVQRGTYHAWINRGSVPCRMAFVLVDAEPLNLGEPLQRDLPHG